MARHKWDLLDKCEKCGIERRIKVFTTKYTMRVKGKFYEYKINGNWQYEMPSCK